MRIWEWICHEVTQLMANRKNLLIIFGAPLIYSLAFGLIYINHVVRDIPAVIYDASQTGLSRTLASGFEDSEKFRVIAYPSSEEELEGYLKRGDAVAAIIIPETFSKDVKKGTASEVLLVVDGSNIIYTNSVTTYGSEIIQTFSAGVTKRSLEALGQTPGAALEKAAPVRMQVRVLNNPAVNYANYMLIGLVLAIVQQSLLLPVALSLIDDRAALFNQRDIPVIRPLSAKAAVYWVLGMASFLISISVIHWGYHVPLRSGLLALLLPVGAFLFAVVSAGMLFSSICPDGLTATQYSMLYAVPAFLFSGYTYPRASMNLAGQLLSALFPLTYIASDLRSLMLAGYAPQLLRNSVILIMIGSAFFAATAVTFARRRQAAAA